VSQTTDDLSLPKQDAGVLFRGEMAFQNFILGYWMYMAGAVVLGLVGVLIYGQVRSSREYEQRSIASEIAKIEIGVREAQGMASYDPSLLNDQQRSDLRGAAEALVALSAERSGPEVASAAMYAADLYRLLGDDAAQLSAFETASAHARGSVAFAASAGQASLLLEMGRGDEAIAAWTALATAEQGFLAEYAQIELARANATLGHPDAARAAYDAFLTRFPSSERTAIAQEERAALGDGA
jgi:hypothetical protein